MYKYKIDPTRTVGATEQTRHTGQMNGRTDGGNDGVKPIYPQQLHCADVEGHGESLDVAFHPEDGLIESGLNKKTEKVLRLEEITDVQMITLLEGRGINRLKLPL